MSRPSKSGGIVVDLLIAVAISLVVNFSYLLVLVVEKSDDRRPPFSREQEADRESVRVEGDVWVSPDGHGYLLYDAPKSLSDDDSVRTGLEEAAPVRDSVYIHCNSARFLRLQSGDRLVADALESRRPGGHPVLGLVLERNGEPFDYGLLLDRPQEGTIFALQLFYFFLARVSAAVAAAPRRREASRAGVSETRPALHGARRGALLHRARGAVADA